MAAEVLSIIVARGGSKGLPNKHLLPLCGKKVIEYTFEYARQAELVNRIVLSTDDDGIAEAAKEHGIETIKRPAEMATDEARIQECLIYTVEFLKEEEGYPDCSYAF